MWAADQLRFILAGILLMSVGPVLTRLSRNDQGKFDYNPMTATLLVEILKIGISTVSLVCSPDRQPLRPSLRGFAMFGAPAAIYAVSNNLNFYILEQVNVTTFQILGQLKTLFTGLLFRVVLGRRLTWVQYMAIWMLACGTAANHIPTCAQELSGHHQKTSSLSGLTMGVISCMFSSLGGIYNEKLLKDGTSDSIHWQNIQLYIWGIAFNLVGAIWNSSAALSPSGLMTGFNYWSWAVVLSNASYGLVCSAILKYADNMARVYTASIAMLFTMFLSISIFGEEPTPQLIIAVCVVSGSVVQYNMKPPSDDAIVQSDVGRAKKIEDAESVRMMGAGMTESEEDSSGEKVGHGV